jgi:hypothetical protein
MLEVRYRGPLRGAYMLSGELTDAGFHVEFDSPTEHRGVGQELVHLALRLESDVEAGLVGGAAVAAVQRVIRGFRERHPDVDVEADRTDDPPPGS